MALVKKFKGQINNPFENPHSYDKLSKLPALNDLEKDAFLQQFLEKEEEEIQETLEQHSKEVEQEVLEKGTSVQKGILQEQGAKGLLTLQEKQKRFKELEGKKAQGRIEG